MSISAKTHILVTVNENRYKEIVRKRYKYDFRHGAYDRSKVKNVYVYVASPVKRIVGTLTIGEILRGKPEVIYRTVKAAGDTIRDYEFNDYFKGCKRAYAWQILEYVPFSKPINPWLLDGWRPPMSYQYIHYNPKVFFSKRYMSVYKDGKL
jgi:predicted transcriptional regulator